MNFSFLLFPFLFSAESVNPLFATPSFEFTTSTMTTATVNNVLDVLIIGGGPAGLSVATGLARQLHTAVVFDSGVYRNAPSKHMHNVATWDHRDPSDFRATARVDILRRYSTIQFQNTTIQSVRKTPQSQFEATDAQGKVWTGRKLMLATGVRDVYPDIDGYADCWAKSMCVRFKSHAAE